MDMDMEDVAVVDRTIIMVGMALNNNNNIDKVNLKDIKIKTMELISNIKEMVIIKEAVEAAIEGEEAVEDIEQTKLLFILISSKDETTSFSYWMKIKIIYYFILLFLLNFKINNSKKKLHIQQINK